MFDLSISDEENDTLCSIPNESEIFQALVSFGTFKALVTDEFTSLL